MKKHKNQETLKNLGLLLKELSMENHNDSMEQLSSWKDLNSLKKSRPMFMIDQICWNEFSDYKELTLQCTDPLDRKIEQDLRRQIFRCKYMPDDRIISPEIRIPKIIDVHNFGMASDVTYTDNKENETSVHGRAFNDLLKNETDIAKIGMPTVVYQKDKTDLLEEKYNSIFDGILDVKMSGILMDFHAWDRIVEWHGVNETIIDLVDRPDFMHKIIQRTLDSRLALLDQLEAQNLLDVGNPLIHCTGAHTDELPGYNGESTDTLDCSSAKNMWTYGAAQIFSTVSPAMHSEFDIKYAKQWYNRFGLGYYGCCEPLDTKIDIIRELPNVRKISLSPWADKQRAAEQIDGDYVMSVKPSPAYLSSNLTWKIADVIDDLKQSIAAAKDNNCQIELILKDISTVGGNPERLFMWAEIARDLCERKYP